MALILKKFGGVFVFDVKKQMAHRLFVLRGIYLLFYWNKDIWRCRLPFSFAQAFSLEHHHQFFQEDISAFWFYRIVIICCILACIFFISY